MTLWAPTAATQQKSGFGSSEANSLVSHQVLSCCRLHRNNTSFSYPLDRSHHCFYNYTSLLFGQSKHSEDVAHKALTTDRLPSSRKISGVWACLPQSTGSKPYLFRTYNHQSTGKAGQVLCNPGIADSAPVWSVARATLAIPALFDKTVVEEKRFVDSSVVINNPSFESYFEVNSLQEEQLQCMHSWKEVSIDPAYKRKPNVAALISIGSGLRPLPESRSQAGLPGMSRVTGVIDQLEWAAWTSTERAHEQIQRVAGKLETSYHRFDVQEGIGSVRQDEWVKMGSTNTTLRLIESMTKQYIEKKVVDEELEACARELVRYRRRQL